jgi:hypothetical protein
MSDRLEARRRDSQIVDGLVCPACGRSLLVFSGSRTLIFYCKSGHDWALRNLLASPSRYVRHGLATLLANWRRKAELLRQTASQAMLDGHSDLAGNFRREAMTLDARAQILEAALAMPSKSSLKENLEERIGVF